MARNVKQQSKKTYLAKRKARVRQLHIHEHMGTRDIAAKLVNDGTIETSDESLESAIRLVREDVREIRAELSRERDEDAPVSFDALDALEYELTDLRIERDYQRMIARGEPDENGQEAELVTNMIGKGGEPVPFIRPKWPAAVRQKASKDAAILAEKISKLEVALAEKRAAKKPATQGKASDGAPVDDGIFRIVTSGKPVDDLIQENASERSKVN
jgi:hypothetical protein